jgi:hypothetical protein
MGQEQSSGQRKMSLGIHRHRKNKAGAAPEQAPDNSVNTPALNDSNVQSERQLEIGNESSGRCIVDPLEEQNTAPANTQHNFTLQEQELQSVSTLLFTLWKLMCTIISYACLSFLVHHS